MRARIIISSGWFYVALGAAAVPIALIIMFLAAGNTSVAWELAILLAVFAAVMILGACTAVTSGELAPTPAAVAAGNTAWDATLGIEWIDEVPLAPLAPVTMRVLKVTGACAFGFMPGNEWVIDANGHLSRPLCAVAVKAFNSPRGGPWNDGLPQNVACHCPLAGNEVVFALDKMDIEEELAETTG